MEAPDPLSGQRAVRAERSRIKGRIRDRARLLDAGRATSKQRHDDPVPEHDRVAEAERQRAERIAETPELGILYLIFWPALVVAQAWRRFRSPSQELRHGSLAFRYHDLAARNPELALVVGLAGALVSVLLPICVIVGLVLLRGELPFGVF